MKNDFIPRSDGDFNIWQIAFFLFLSKNISLWGILEADFIALQALQAAWTTAYEKGSAKQTRNAADIQRKDDARKAFVKAIRAFVAKWLAKNDTVTNGDREELGITVPSDTKTPAPEMTTRPILSVNHTNPQEHVVSIRDSEDETSRAKPKGAFGCALYRIIVNIGEPVPQDTSKFTYIGTDTRSPYVVRYTDKEVGKMVYYVGRWVDKRGNEGPFGNIVGAIVTPL